MMKILIKDVKAIKALFIACDSIVSEINLFVEQKGLRITQMDGSHICLINVFIAKEDCDIYEISTEYRLGINIDDMTKLLGRLDNSEYLQISHNPSNKNIILEYLNYDDKKAKKYTMSLIDIDYEEINLDNLSQLPFSNTYNIQFKYMNESIKDVEILSEVLEIEGCHQGIKMIGTGTLGNYEQLFEKEQLISSDFSQYSNCSYAIQFLKQIMKSEAILTNTQSRAKIKPITSFELKLGSEMPAKFRVNFYNESYIEYYLAPRVEEDSESMYEEEVTTSISHSNEELVQSYSKPIIAQPIQINATIMQAQMNVASQIDALDSEIAKLSNLYQSSRDFPNIQMGIAEQIQTKTDLTVQLEKEFNQYF